MKFVMHIETLDGGRIFVMTEGEEGEGLGNTLIGAGSPSQCAQALKAKLIGVAVMAQEEEEDVDSEDVRG